MRDPDVTVIGSGPNGLSAAVTMARAGLSVRVFELYRTVGGGTRTAEITRPGFRHDMCSAVHPMAFASPFFRRFGLDRRVEFVVPEVSYGHAFSADRAVLAYRDLDRTAAALGADGPAWARMFRPLVENVDDIVDFTTGQLIRLPPHLISATRFGLRVLQQGSPLWGPPFNGPFAPAMLGGVNAHSVGRMPSLTTAGAGLMLATLAHTGGWPIPVGGSQRIADALAEDLLQHGGEIVTDHRVTSLADIPPSRVVLFDTSARWLVQIVGDALPARYRKAVGRFTYGNAASKVDFALSEPVPWANPDLARTPTIHVGGDRSVLARSESSVADGRYPADPYLLLSQPSLFDSERAPSGRHVLWTYTHVPNGSTRDMTEAITARIEQFAPGFRDVILESRATTAAELEEYNPNYIGGDFSAGANTLLQLFKRPVFSPTPWRTPAKGVYLCSSSTPPGPGVHGMSGWHAAVRALRDCFDLTPPDLAPEPGLTHVQQS